MKGEMKGKIKNGSEGWYEICLGKLEDIGGLSIGCGSCDEDGNFWELNNESDMPIYKVYEYMKKFNGEVKGLKIKDLWVIDEDGDYAEIKGEWSSFWDDLEFGIGLMGDSGGYSLLDDDEELVIDMIESCIEVNVCDLIAEWEEDGYWNWELIENCDNLVKWYDEIKEGDIKM